MSRVISMRLQEEQLKRLQRFARRLGRTVSEAGALLVEESLRRDEFCFIDFRDSPAGRQAYLQGTGLAVWEVLMVAQSYSLDADRTAEHLGWTAAHVQAALNYAAAFPDEIYPAIEENDAADFLSLSRLLPQLRRFPVDDENRELLTRG